MVTVAKLHAGINDCRETCWYICLLCLVRLGRCSGSYHFSKKCKKHVEKYRDAVREQQLSRAMNTSDKFCQMNQNMACTLQQKRSVSTLADVDCVSESKRMRPILDNEGTTEGKMPAFDDQPITILEAGTKRPEVFPRRKVDKVGQWVEAALVGRDVASIKEVRRSFLGLEEMDYYFTMEHRSPKNCTGQGIVYLVARSTQRSKFLCSHSIPSVQEAFYQFACFSQHMSLSKKQRRRQAKIASAMSSHPTFFNATSVVEYSDLDRTYGPTGMHSIWNILPIPPVRNLNGCGYSNPMHVL